MGAPHNCSVRCRESRVISNVSVSLHLRYYIDSDCYLLFLGFPNLADSQTLCTNEKVSLFTSKQTSANNSTWYCYLSKICRFVNYLFRDLYKMTLNYLVFSRLKYLYFRQIIWLFIKSNQVNSNYSCFWPFMGQSQIIFRL